MGNYEFHGIVELSAAPIYRNNRLPVGLCIRNPFSASAVAHNRPRALIDTRTEVFTESGLRRFVHVANK